MCICVLYLIWALYCFHDELRTSLRPCWYLIWNKGTKRSNRDLYWYLFSKWCTLKIWFFSEINIHKRRDSQSLCSLLAKWQMCAYEAFQRWESQWNSLITTHQQHAATCFPQPNITRTWGHKKETAKRLLKVHFFQATWKMEHEGFTMKLVRLDNSQGQY